MNQGNIKPFTSFEQNIQQAKEMSFTSAKVTYDHSSYHVPHISFLNQQNPPVARNTLTTLCHYAQACARLPKEDIQDPPPVKHLSNKNVYRAIILAPFLHTPHPIKQLLKKQLRKKGTPTERYQLACSLGMQESYEYIRNACPESLAALPASTVRSLVKNAKSLYFPAATMLLLVNTLSLHECLENEEYIKKYIPKYCSADSPCQHTSIADVLQETDYTTLMELIDDKVWRTPGILDLAERNLHSLYGLSQFIQQFNQYHPEHTPIKHLKLDNNHLTYLHIPTLLKLFPKLRSITATNNALTTVIFPRYLPDNFHLYLQHNSITHIPPFRLGNQAYIDLRNNCLDKESLKDIDDARIPSFWQKHIRYPFFARKCVQAASFGALIGGCVGLGGLLLKDLLMGEEKMNIADRFILAILGPLLSGPIYVVARVTEGALWACGTVESLPLICKLDYAFIVGGTIGAFLTPIILCTTTYYADLPVYRSSILVDLPSIKYEQKQQEISNNF